MISINLSEVNSKIQIATIILEKMENNGITKKELIYGVTVNADVFSNVVV